MMTAERFLALVAAWGAAPRRWPSAERAAADAFVAARPEVARQALSDADAVDALLQASPTPAVPAALRDRVLASAAGAGLRSRNRPRRWADRLALSLGVGWAAAACAGVVAGMALTGHISAAAEADAVLYQASLVPVDDVEVLG